MKRLTSALYSFFVARVPGIHARVLPFYKRTNSRVFTLFYALLLNACYLVGFRFLKTPPPYREKKLFCASSESARAPLCSPKDFASSLCSFDVISFDIFDTLILRRVSKPEEVFYFVGMALCYPDFCTIRKSTEQQARVYAYQNTGSYEVTLSEIWDVLSKQTGIPKEIGIQTELRCERACCFANPYLKEVIALLQQANKRIVLCSDTYFTELMIDDLLSSCGYQSLHTRYLSCAFRQSKADSRLFVTMCKTEGMNRSIVHVGDHPISDQAHAKACGLSVIPYRNVNALGAPYRTDDLSPIVGALYRGITNAHLYASDRRYSRAYEYGYIYGGLFVTGFCAFIHKTARLCGIDTLLFLSRDGAVLQKAYHLLYGEQALPTKYVCWSRRAATKLTAGYYRALYFARFFGESQNPNETIRDRFEKAELMPLLAPFCRQTGCSPDTRYTHKTSILITDYLKAHMDDVLSCYAPQRAAANAVFSDLLKNCRHAACVDIGWAGSNLFLLFYLVNELFSIPCKLTGILGGTTSQNISPSDTPEPFLASGTFFSYLFSMGKNRDLFSFHRPLSDHNLAFELLLGDTTGAFLGYYPDAQGKPTARFFGGFSSYTPEIHRGILDFCAQYKHACDALSLPVSVSGRDAYAPMKAVLSPKNRAYLKQFEEEFDEGAVLP